MLIVDNYTLGCLHWENCFMDKNELHLDSNQGNSNPRTAAESHQLMPNLSFMYFHLYRKTEIILLF